MTILSELFYVIFFPGMFFLLAYSFFVEWFDRKLYAKMQNRVGPPIFQPFADFIKLLSKEDIIPKKAKKLFFNSIPIISFAAVMTAFLYIPIYSLQSPLGFQGDILLILYLTSLPTLLLFLAGWYSGNIFSAVGAYRELSQFFVYEVAFFLVILGPVILVDSWSISDMIKYQQNHLWMFLLEPIGFVVALMCLEAKLERVPFDIPEAETEIVGGTYAEYSGKKLALLRLTTDISMVVGASLISALFLGGPSVLINIQSFPLVIRNIIGLIVFFLKTLFIIFILSIIRTAFARIRIDQMTTFGWKWLGLLSLLQIGILIIMKTLLVF